jgi:hypothetical protein
MLRLAGGACRRGIARNFCQAIANNAQSVPAHVDPANADPKAGEVRGGSLLKMTEGAMRLDRSEHVMQPQATSS